MQIEKVYFNKKYEMTLFKKLKHYSWVEPYFKNTDDLPGFESRLSTLR